MSALTLIADRRFLIVDDDPLILASCEERLVRFEATAFTAEDIAQALRRAEEEQPDFVLLDLTIGEQVVTADVVGCFQQALQTLERRVILHSAVSATELYQQAHRLSALGAVQKTGDERIFLHRVSRLIELSLAIAGGATDRPSIPY